MTNFAENWNAQASSSQETSKSKWKPEVIQGQGIEAGKVPEDVVLGSGYVSAHTESTESPIDMKEVVAGKIPEPPKFEGTLPEPREHGIESPIDFKKVATGEVPELPKFKGTLPKPKPYKKAA